MRVVQLHGGFLLRQRPLYLVSDSGEDGDDVVALDEAYDREIAGGELDTVVLVDKVDNGAGDFDEDLFGGHGRSGRLR